MRQRGDGLIAKAVKVLEAYDWKGYGDMDQAMAELAGAVLAERRRVRERVAALRAAQAQRTEPLRSPEWERRAQPEGGTR